MNRSERGKSAESAARPALTIKDRLNRFHRFPELNTYGPVSGYSDRRIVMGRERPDCRNGQEHAHGIAFQGFKA